MSDKADGDIAPSGTSLKCSKEVLVIPVFLIDYQPFASSCSYAELKTKIIHNDSDSQKTGLTLQSHDDCPPDLVVEE